MPNYIWYLALAVISSLLLIYTLWKARNRRILVLYFFAVGVTYLFEYLILVLFESYTYFPMLLKNRYFDNILGAVVSDAFSVPMSCVFIGVFQLRLRGILFFSSSFVGIQAFFEYLKIYKDNWWTLYYTWPLLIVAFYISKVWYLKLNQPISQFLRFCNVFLCSISISASTVFVLVAFFNTYFYRVTWFQDLTRGHVAFATFYLIVISITLTTLIILNIRWYLVTTWLAIFSLADYWFYHQGILILKNWHLINFFLLHTGCYIFLLLFDKTLLISKKIP